MLSFEDTAKSTRQAEFGRSQKLAAANGQFEQRLIACLNPSQKSTPAILLAGESATGKSRLIRQIQHFYKTATFAEAFDGKPNGHPSANQSSDNTVTALLDFSIAPHRYQRPQDPFYGLLMLRRQFTAHHILFAIFDFACIVYLKKTAQLTPERLRHLFPIEIRGLMFEMADLVLNISLQDAQHEIFNIISQVYRDQYTPYMMHRNPGEALCEQILTMKAERELLPALPELFAAELRAAVNMPAGPGRIVLLLDGLHELASPVTEIQDAATVLGDGWVRQLVHHLTDTPGLLTILAVRSANDWQKRFPFSRKRSTCSVFELDYLTEAQAEHFFAAQDIEDENLKSAFKAWAESKPNGYHPVLLGVCTDIMRIQNAKGKDVDPREFRIVPKTEEERFHGLSKKFFQVLDRERSFALITLSACQAIDLSAFLLLSQTFYYEEREELFRAIGNFSFVDEKHNGVQHSLHLHPAIAPYVKKYGNKLVREARQTLLEDFREKAKTGDETAEAEAMFHTNALDWELGIVTFLKYLIRHWKSGALATCACFST